MLYQRRNQAQLSPPPPGSVKSMIYMGVFGPQQVLRPSWTETNVRPCYFLFYETYHKILPFIPTGSILIFSSSPSTYIVHVFSRVGGVIGSSLKTIYSSFCSSNSHSGQRYLPFAGLFFALCASYTIYVSSINILLQ